MENFQIYLLIIWKITILVAVDANNLCEKACMLYLVSHGINYNYTHTHTHLPYRFFLNITMFYYLLDYYIATLTFENILIFHKSVMSSKF